MLSRGSTRCLALLVTAIIAVGVVVRFLPYILYGVPICVDCLGRAVIARLASHCAGSSVLHVLDVLFMSYLEHRCVVARCVTTMFTFPEPLCVFARVSPLPELLLLPCTSPICMYLISIIMYVAFGIYLAIRYVRLGLSSRALIFLLLYYSLSIVTVSRLGFGNVDDTLIGTPLLAIFTMLLLEGDPENEITRTVTALLTLSALVFTWKGAVLASVPLGLAIGRELYSISRRNKWKSSITLLLLCLGVFILIGLFNSVFVPVCVTVFALLGYVATLRRRATIPIMVMLLLFLSMWLVASVLVKYGHVNMSIQLAHLSSPLLAQYGFPIGEESPPDPVSLIASLGILVFLYPHYLVESLSSSEDSLDKVLHGIAVLTYLLLSLSYSLLLVLSLLAMLLDRGFTKWLSGKALRSVPIYLFGIAILVTGLVKVYPHYLAYMHGMYIPSNVVPRGSNILNSWSLGYHILYTCPTCRVATSPLTENPHRIEEIHRLLTREPTQRVVEYAEHGNYTIITILVTGIENISKQSIAYKCIKNTTTPRLALTYRKNINHRTVICIFEINRQDHTKTCKTRSKQN